MPKSIRALALLALAGVTLAACEPQSEPAPGPTLVAQHERAAQIAAWTRARTVPAAFTPGAHSAADVLAAKHTDPYGAAALFAYLLAASNIPYRVWVVYGVPDLGWVPVVEVADEDGDHAWEPYGARFAPDYDATPLPLYRWVTSETTVRYEGSPAEARRYRSEPTDMPSLRELGALPRFELRPGVGAIYPLDVDLRGGPVAFGTVDGSPADLAALRPTSDGAYPAAVSAVGDLTLTLGKASFAVKFVLTGAAVGDTVRLRYRLTAGKAAHLLFVGTGAKTLGRTGGEIRFRVTAEHPSVSVAAEDGTHVIFDALTWERP